MARDRDREPEWATQPLSNVDRLVHEPARLLILSQLYVIEAGDFLFIQKQTGLTKGNLSSHLAKLEDAGYVEITKEFQGKRPRTLLQLTPSGREAFSRHVDSLRQWIEGVPN